MIARYMRSNHLSHQSLLSDDVKDVLYWFKDNQMVAANPAKYEVMFLGTKDTNIEFLLENTSIVSCKFVKLLRICINKELNFKRHISTVLKIQAILSWKSQHNAVKLLNSRSKLILKFQLVNKYKYHDTKY